MAERATPNGTLHDAFVRIVESGLFTGSHVSLDHDMHGEMTVNIAPDWIEGRALRFLLGVASELELSLALTKHGLRLDEPTGETARNVQAVKDVLAAERENDEDDRG